MSRPIFVILAEDKLGLETSKTAASTIRYLPERVCAVIDSEHAGLTSQDVLGVGGDIPVVASLAEALAVTRATPQALLVGVANRGGTIPPEHRPVLFEAVEAGLDVWSGLHERLADDPELVALARQRGVRLVDLRDPPADLPVGTGLALGTDAFRVLTVGTDCNVGKMTASLEIRLALRERDVDARFAATGQSGIVIDGAGIPVDAVVSDFVSGATERITLEAAEGADVVLVEGQGSLFHPGYSAVTLGLLHGSMPHAMILCWMPGRKHVYAGGYDWVEIPTPAEAIAAYEEAMRWAAPQLNSRVVGLSANTYDLAEDEARRVVEEAGVATGLPSTDPVRFGAEALAEAVEAAWKTSARG
ncbi:MAG: DUF1611 domain-containing protein [marine benthic group bacterium]|nr:DUF1611 domain-containing protein [Gemmatimonadota bacterium]